MTSRTSWILPAIFVGEGILANPTAKTTTKGSDDPRWIVALVSDPACRTADPASTAADATSTTGA
ncbi:hypothetical protein K227x_46050 [Rubripirellula lacrimiformis]|uniref:Uncharacterized protein n=1 Tax=Rubripirellula lacrimiformis TaxID=1930273 RepID=A0A517NGD2_9BACT|nr:hypothetical protein K227x_46050 [Rubripirellula lacrimiformis]